MTFGYDARAWLTTKDSSSSKRTFVFAGDLLVWLQNKRILTESLGRPIILIGHSLGGIVIKKVREGYVLEATTWYYHRRN